MFITVQQLFEAKKAHFEQNNFLGAGVTLRERNKQYANRIQYALSIGQYLLLSPTIFTPQEIEAHQLFVAWLLQEQRGSAIVIEKTVLQIATSGIVDGTLIYNGQLRPLAIAIYQNKHLFPPKRNQGSISIVNYLVDNNLLRLEGKAKKALAAALNEVNRERNLSEEKKEITNDLRLVLEKNSTKTE